MAIFNNNLFVYQRVFIIKINQIISITIFSSKSRAEHLLIDIPGRSLQRRSSYPPSVRRMHRHFARQGVGRVGSWDGWLLGEELEDLVARRCAWRRWR